MSFSEQLKKAMLERNMNQAELSALTGIGKSSQRGIAPFGFAVKLSGEKFSYHISPKKLNEYIGL